jgi:hypothetical protein
MLHSISAGLFKDAAGFIVKDILKEGDKPRFEAAVNAVALGLQRQCDRTFDFVPRSAVAIADWCAYARGLSISCSSRALPRPARSVPLSPPAPSLRRSVSHHSPSLPADSSQFNVGLLHFLIALSGNGFCGSDEQEALVLCSLRDLLVLRRLLCRPSFSTSQVEELESHIFNTQTSFKAAFEPYSKSGCGTWKVSTRRAAGGAHTALSALPTRATTTPPPAHAATR